MFLLYGSTSVIACLCWLGGLAAFASETIRAEAFGWLPDSDDDGVVDRNDDCSQLDNSEQRDTDSDGLGLPVMRT